MRFTEIRTLTEEQLDELRMNPSSLRAFVDSPEAEGIRAGFEAELVFKGLGEDDYDEIEPDMDMDERCRSIEEVIDFFGNDDWGYGLSPRGERELRNGLDEMYMEWFDEQMYDAFRDEAVDLIRQVIEDEDWDWDDAIREQLDSLGLSDEEIDAAMEAGNSAPRYTKLSDQNAAREASKAYDNYLEAKDQAEEMLNTQADNSYQDQDGFYDTALDQFRDNFSIDDDSHFFSDVGLRWMSDVRDQFDLDWPYMRGGDGGEGGYSYDNAERLADDLHEKLGFKTKASNGYHSARRDDVTWIFEPDSSLDASESGDMPVEIISPPMPLKDALANMKAFFEWAESNGAYSNDSTGFHMGISLPHRGGDVDFVKLALFLGDEHVLQEFGRASNHFCEAAMKKIKNRVKGGSADVAGALTLMKNNLLELASRSIQKGGFGKYTSINPNQKYIEFRSAGGHDEMGQSYFENIDKIQNTMMRYAQAMAVAGNPAAERKEYYKKLYKLIAPSTGDIGLDLFARFTSGTITKEELKKQWAESILQKDAPDLIKKSTWELYDKVAGKTVPGNSYSGYSYDEAMDRAKQKLSPGGSMEGFKKQYELIDMNQNTGRWSIVDRETGETLEVVDAATRGEAADQVYDKYTKDGKGYFVRPYVEFDQPEPKLSRRAELAKRIKQPKSQPASNRYEIIDRRTGEVVLRYRAADAEDAGDGFNNWLRNQGLPTDTENYGYRPEQSVQDVPMDVAQNFQDPANYNGRWEILNPDGGLISHVTGNLEDAENARRQVMFRYENPAGVTARPSPMQTQPANRSSGQFTGQWKIVNANTGEELHRFGGVGNVQADANRIATNWVRQTRLDDPIEVLPVMD